MKKDTFIKGAYMATICIFISKFLGIVYVIPFYSIIGEQGGALYGYAYSIYSIFLSVSTAGIPTAVSKLISEYDARGEEDAKNRVYKEALKMISFLCLTVFVFLMVFAPQIGRIIIGDATGGNSIEDISKVIRFISFAIVTVPFLSVTRGLLQGNKYVTPTSKSEIIEQILRISVLLLGSYVVVKLLQQSITLGVCISVLGASVGALGAYLYLRFVIRKNKIILKSKNNNKELGKSIRKKIIKYAIPLIIVSVVLAVYNFSDMVITLRVITGILDYGAKEAEQLISIYTTWGEKFQRIIVAAATGVGVSLIPNIVRAYVKKNSTEVEKLMIKAVELVIFIGLPITILISIFSTEVWNIFYGYSTLGPIIIGYSIFLGLFSSLSTVGTTALQAINKFKHVYFSIIIGMVMNALLDAPLILLMYKLGFNPCYGSITASVFGFGLTIYLSFHYIKKECNIRFNKLLFSFKKLLLPIIILITSSYVLKYLFPINNYDSRFITIVYTCFYFGIPLLLYIIVSYNNKLLGYLFGEDRISKVSKFFKRGE